MKIRLPFLLALFTMLLFGAFEMLRGISAPFMQADWHLTYLQIGNIFLFDSCGYMLGTFCCGWVIGRLGMRLVMILGATGMAIGTIVIVTGSSYFMLLPAFFFLGLGAGFLEIAANDVVPAMEKTQEGQARYFNWLHGVYGLGACLFPLVAAGLISTFGNWRWVYGLLLFAVLVILVVALVRKRSLLLRMPKTKPAGEALKPNDRGLFRSPLLYAFLGCIVTYVMAEMTIAAWLPTFLMRIKGLTVGHSSAYLSGFYLAFTIGRLSAPLWVNKVGNVSAILMSALVAILFLSLAIFGGPYFHTFFWLAGFAFAVIFPTIAAMASSMFPEHSGRVLGMLFTSASIGTFCVNWLIGAISTLLGLATGFLIIFVFLIALVISIVIVARLKHISTYPAFKKGAS
ncbi:fucose permease [Pullulanibacillus pueri]|uniref:MFS transporter n=1 Tax=Pullulanibacillus pueri TaxID=1437324 RepID=A0A8J2ZTS0_9BACL|nr:MFS transporter [Pullulanibacillus pueri]MBM7681103.1 fucose permease [Pullulanibacillus pueri]GGH77057.1 MFS transporter [Pullulanibacillus pueri]